MGTTGLPPEEQLLFALTRQRLLASHHDTVQRLCRTATIRWPLVATIAQQHGVAPMLYANALQCPGLAAHMHPPILKQLQGCAAYSMITKARRAEQLTDILAFFHHKCLDVLLIKSAALDLCVYDKPWYTLGYDLDISVRVKSHEISRNERQEITNFLQKLDGIEFEYSDHHDVTMNGILSVDFQSIWHDARKIRYHSQEVFVMSPEDMLLTACINSCRKRYFKLKNLFDIATIVEKNAGLQWPVFIEKARAYQCQAIAYAALFITQSTVGCDLPEDVLARLTPAPLRAAMIRWLSQHRSCADLASFARGLPLFGRQVGPSILLPYATYRWQQAWRSLWLVWRGEA